MSRVGIAILVRSMICGLLLTVLTSWALAVFGVFTKGELVATYDKRNTRVPVSLVPDGWDPRSWHYFTGFGMRRDLVSECEWMGSTLGMTMDGRPQRTVVHLRVGFPMLAMTWYDYHSEMRSKGGRSLAEWCALGVPLGMQAKVTPTRWRVEPRLPLRPLWLGFAVDAAAYSLLAWGAITGVGAWRRSRRRSRGLCVACAHSLVGLAICPECGTPNAAPTMPESREGAAA